jgi:DNA-binding GntR family transcriptional regulator
MVKARLNEESSDLPQPARAPAQAATRHIVTQPSYEQVRDALREDIVAGVFSGNERLVVSVLCERYGVSAPPVREALNQLQVEGLVVISANRGARVRAITAEFVREIFEIRIVLESALVARSVPLFTAEDERRLSAIQDDFEAAVAARNHPAVVRCNWAFHCYIYGLNPNHEAMRLLNMHSAVIATMRNRFGYEADRFNAIHAEHRALIKACAAHDVRRARAIARRHIEHSVTDLIARMNATPPGMASIWGTAPSV